MNWKQNLFKPKWQHKNAEIRLESVATEQHPDLIKSLLEIAANDEDAKVRCAAIKRLHQLENILKLHGNEKNEEVKRLLEERIRQLASSSDESRPPLEFRTQVAQTTTDRDLIEHLASHAPESELRKAALARVQRQGVLGDCCIQDSDPENRRYAASRISQHTTLKRVIDALRKRDKALHGELQKRLHKELLEKGDPKAVQTEALNICTALEKQALLTNDRDNSQIKALHKTWQDIADKAGNDITERYQRVSERLTAPKTRPAAATEADTIVKIPEAAVIPAHDNEPADAPAVNEPLARAVTAICLYEIENADRPNAASVAKLKKQMEKIWNRCNPPHPEDLAGKNKANAALERLEKKLLQLSQQFEKDLDKGKQLLEQLENELEQGGLHKALETRAKLQHLGKGHGKNKDWKALNSKLSGMQARLRELRDWHHWSNNKIRKRLIAEMEVLPSADLHPDALLDRIKSLQKEWKELEQSEQIPGDKHFAAAPWMWRKFSAAGHAAFDTAKPYLEKRSEIQSRHAQSLATFCAELKQLAEADPVNWTALSKGLNRGRKAALDQANSVMQEHYKDVDVEKMKLIRAASQLVHLPERSEAIAEAKSLQSSWKAAGSLWRSKEQQLWNQFREYLDPLFEELKEKQASIRAADQERLAAQKALCTELQDILKSEDDLAAMHGKVQGLQDSWKDIRHPDRRLVQTFQDMVSEYQQKVDEVRQRQVNANRDRRWLKSALLHELTVSGRTVKGALSKKTETRVNNSWPQDSSDDPLEIQMDDTCREIMAGSAVETTAEDIEALQQKARALCIQLEFIAGLPSPDEDRDQRMKYQVDRLAESMSGEKSRQPATVEALEAEKVWLAMYSLPETDFEAFGKRVKQALSKISEN
jgi:hypothetical protein